jgi:hypothetical protein
MGRAATRDPGMIRGSVVTQRRKCGKPSCRCAAGDTLHETTVLSYSDAGRTRLLRLPPSQIAAVQAATERYRAALGAVEAQGEAGRAALVARLSGPGAGR